MRAANITPAPYQAWILDELARTRRVAVWGPHGFGKTTTAAWAVLTFAKTWDGHADWKAVTTATVWRQLTEYLWPEIRRWAPRFGLSMRVTKQKIEGTTGAAFAAASDNAGKIEGAHASHLLYVLDEAKLIPDDTWRAALSAMTTHDCYVLALSTPGISGTYLYKVATGKIRGWQCRHVTLEEAISAGRISQEWVTEMAEQWGRDTPEFRRRVLGEWVDVEGDGSLFPSAALLAATELDPGERPVCLGVDVARGGGDYSAISIRRTGGVSEVMTLNVRDLMQLCGVVANLMTELRVPAVVDTTGLGAGVYDRLREQGLDVYPFQSALRPNNPDGIRRWANLRAQAYVGLSDQVRAGSFALPRDDELLEQLQWIRVTTASDGSVRIIPKDEMPASPDKADAVMMAWALELVRGPEFDIF